MILKLVAASHMADWVQFRFPKSKKKRIRKKWAKRKENWKFKPWQHAFHVGNVIFAHPEFIEQIKKQIGEPL